MSGANFILAINLAVAGLIAAAFLTIASYEKTRTAGRWLAAAYMLGIAYAAVEFAIRLLGGEVAVVALSAAVLLSGMAAFNMGVAHRYGFRPPVSLLLIIVVTGALTSFPIDALPRHSFIRMMAFQAPYFLMQAVAAVIVFRGIRDSFDRVLATLLALSALHFMFKPFIAHAVGGWGANPGAYLGSNYALVSQSLGTVFAIAVALVTMVVLVRDILGDATTKSETDTLSGLYNRRGFERRAARAVDHSADTGMALSLVVSDLDHFKAVNDTYGHACGDRVIAAFARFLREATSGSEIAGRLGGEEFAIVLPGASLASARLFAEGARSAFSNMPVDGLPEDRRFTASFGVAELDPGENVEDLMHRADHALYEAKRAGRDCVRVTHGVGAAVADNISGWRTGSR